MIISKSFTLEENVGSGIYVSTPSGGSTQTYPIVTKFLVDSMNQVLEDFNACIEYNEQTGEASMGGIDFVFTANLSYIGIYIPRDVDLGNNSVTAKFSGNTKSYASVITVKGTPDSFEVYVAAGLDVSNPVLLFGKYSLRRLADGAILTAFRRNNTSGNFWVFDNGQLKEYASVIKPDGTYAYSDSTYSGYALIPAVLTNFAYQIVDAYLYCPMLESGNHYTIAGVSVVAVQSCLLLKC